MAINFIPNDPLAGTGAPVMRQISAVANRPSNRAGFIFHSPQQARTNPALPAFSSGNAAKRPSLRLKPGKPTPGSIPLVQRAAPGPGAECRC